VLLLTTYDPDANIFMAMEAGAIGYLLKDAPRRARRRGPEAAAGRSALAPAIAQRLLDHVRAPAEALSLREIEVLQLVAEGLSNKRIRDGCSLARPP
jgi:DNA-binding NarL/FixJ family response regulator